MFRRTTKKRPAKAILRTQAEDDDEDDEGGDDDREQQGAEADLQRTAALKESLSRNKSGKKKARRGMVAGGGGGNDGDIVGGAGDNDNDAAADAAANKNGTIHQGKKKRERKAFIVSAAAALQDDVDEGDDAFPASRPLKRGMGYGGGGLAGPEDSGDGEEERQVDVGGNQPPASSTAGYDREALSRLQSEQKRYVPPPEKEEVLQQQQPPDSKAGEDAGALGGGNSVTARRRDEDVVNLKAPSSAAAAAGQGEDGESAEADTDPYWEAQVARRAGVRVPEPKGQDSRHSQPTRLSPSGGGSGSGPPVATKLLSMQQVRSQAETTLEQQRQRIRALNDTLRRREVQVQQLQGEHARQQSQVKQSGEAVEYYQVLRQKLVSWVGALRQLQSRVIPIQQAMHEIEASMTSTQQQRTWEDDMVAVLFEHNRLEQVLGRQPDPSLFDPVSAVTTDEFGRDVKSQKSIQREQRARERQRVRQQREKPLRGDETDMFLTDEEKEALRERHNALLQALKVAKEELDPEYVSLQNIVNIFTEWKREFQDDYDQCYASLSLADLAAVLIQAELCSLNDPWNESQGYNEGKWIAVIHAAQRMHSPSVLDSTAIERIMEKAVYPSVCDLLAQNGYDLVSNRQARSLSLFCKHVQKVAGNDSPILAKLRTRFISYMDHNFQEIAIPIVRAIDNDPQQNSEELEEVMNGATSGQMLRIKKIIINLLLHWEPVLGEDDAFVELVLDFVCNKFLFLLSSLQQHQMLTLPTNLLLSESPENAFTSVYGALEGTGWLSDTKWMLQAAPIRAAAAAYTPITEQQQ